MRVPAHDNLKPGGRGIKVKVVKVMQDVNRRRTALHNVGGRQAGSPGRGVNIPFDDGERSNRSQRVENFRIAHVPGVDDEVGTSKGLQGFFAQQAVSIRDEADQHALRVARRVGKTVHSRMLVDCSGNFYHLLRWISCAGGPQKAACGFRPPDRCSD